MDKLIRIFNILFFIFFLVLAVVIAIQPSKLPVILIYSMARFVLIILMIMLSFYFCLSIFSKRWAEINLLLFIGLFIGVISIEILFSANPRLMPIKFIRYFAPPLREITANAQGLTMESSIEGNGLLYHYRPLTKVTNAFSNAPVLIDDIGFRNTVAHQNKVDVVLLGDSFIFGYASPVDLGELLRQKGFRVLNLAIPGYAPQHWVDAYQKYGKKTKPKYVFCFLFDGNDFDEAIKYNSLFKTGKPYRDYRRTLIVAPDPKRDMFLYSFVNRSYFFSCFRAIFFAPALIFPCRDFDSDILSINGRQVKMQYNFFTPSPEVIKSDGFKFTIDSIKKVKNECNKTGAKLIWIYLPAHSTVYAPYSQRYKIKSVHQKTISQKISKICKKENILFIDVTGTFQEKINNKTIFLINDGHLHPEGISLLSDIILKKIAVLE